MTKLLLDNVEPRPVPADDSVLTNAAALAYLQLEKAGHFKAYSREAILHAIARAIVSEHEDGERSAERLAKHAVDIVQSQLIDH